MNSKVFKVIRIIFGVLLVVFGANKFANFMPAPENIPDAVMNYMTALTSTKTLILVGLVEIVAGLAFVFNKFGGLLAIILMSVSVNALLFHLTLDPDNSIGAVILLILNIVVLFGYKDKYKALLSQIFETKKRLKSLFFLFHSFSN